MHLFEYSIQYLVDGAVVPFRVAIAADDGMEARRMAWDAIRAEQRRLQENGARYVDLASFKTVSVDGKAV